MDPSSQPAQAQRGHFGTTHWSVVLAAARTHSPEVAQALEALCIAYRNPLYLYARRRGLSPAEAEDLTHDFFAQRIISKLIFKGVSPEAGKFRTWLLNSFQNFLRNDWQRQNAQKRGGGKECLSLDFQDAEGSYLLDPGHDETPEKLYDRAWALTLMERALQQLRVTYESAGDPVLFEVLARYLPGALDPPPYRETAERLGKTEGAVKMAVSRLKQDYGAALKAEIRRTLSENGDEEEERRHLLAILGGAKLVLLSEAHFVCSRSAVVKMGVGT
jgi:RNA polymerase sigma-70 factor (ECF subfamily)